MKSIIHFLYIKNIIIYPLHFLEPLVALSEDLESISNFSISKFFNFTKVIIILNNKNKSDDDDKGAGKGWLQQDYILNVYHTYQVQE